MDEIKPEEVKVVSEEAVVEPVVESEEVAVETPSESNEEVSQPNEPAEEVPVV